FQKLRITNWSRCPNWEAARGPLCVQVRRWGFPHSPLHPVFTPSRVHIDVTYTFFAGLPWFSKRSEMTVVQDLSIAALRDDEWVFSGFPFTDPLWLDAAGTVHEGPVPDVQHQQMQGLGYFNRDSRDAFIALWLDLSAEGFDGLQRWASPDHYYRPHGHCWSRYPVGHSQVLRAGTVLRQWNAYLVAPYFEPGGAAAMGRSRGDVLRGPIYGDEDGPTVVGALRSRLLHPLQVVAADPPAVTATVAGALARPGEGEAETDLKRILWAALREVFDAQFYQNSANVYDMGYVSDLRLRGDIVTVLVTMPHRGRPIHSFIGDPIRERLLQVEGVREVLIEGTWEPAWATWRMTEEGREAMGVPWG
ncbi:MAG: metal-sulfur cluster assembly factor, partial [Armatimonadetes bacterium]|nr:metal-sulfur cluster assembly factor [Armatimonadota bacterium]